MPLLHPLKRPYERHIRSFGKHLPQAVQGEVEPLHQCRVATRRLREILPLCAADIPAGAAKRARRRLRRVGRALGGVREIDVAIGIVTELRQKQTLGVTPGARLRRHLDDERDERRERMLDRLATVNPRKLERDLADVARALGMRQQTDAWAQTLARRMARRGQRVREAVAAAGALYIPDRVHAVRIATKRLRYTLEFAGATREARTKMIVQRLKDVQETLGRLHDLEILQAMIQDLTFPGAQPEAWNGDLEALRRELDRECRELHSVYVGERLMLLELSDAAMHVATRIWTDRGGELSTGRALKMTLGRSAVTDRTVASGRR